MKQQLKRIVAAQIRELQKEVDLCKYEVSFFERLSNKNDPNTVEKFQTLNVLKNVLRKEQRKLKNLVKLQCEIKSMTGYITKETGFTLSNVGLV